MIRLQTILTVACWTVTCVVTNHSSGQTTGQQAFRVVVPSNASVSAPPAEQQLVHDESNEAQAFLPQQWTVRGNTDAGVSVTFEATTPFRHTTQPNFERDVALALSVDSVSGPASWTITAESAESNYAAGNSTAIVSAGSNGVGRARLSLSVSFITDNFGTFATGDYLTTVVGTVTPK